MPVVIRDVFFSRLKVDKSRTVNVLLRLCLPMNTGGGEERRGEERMRHAVSPMCKEEWLVFTILMTCNGDNIMNDRSARIFYTRFLNSFKHSGVNFLCAGMRHFQKFFFIISLYSFRRLLRRFNETIKNPTFETVQKYINILYNVYKNNKERDVFL